MDLLSGVALALVVGAFATVVGFDRDRVFYPAMMIVIAGYYVLFAVIGGDPGALVVELIIMGLFVAVTVAGFRWSLWLVVAALFAHGVLDAVHAGLVDNPGVPEFWPMFCMAFDIVAAGYLAVLLLYRVRRRTVWTTGASGCEYAPRPRRLGEADDDGSVCLSSRPARVAR
jgi:hypothetical protein